MKKGYRLLLFYSATSIIRTSFIRNLNYPELLQISKYISTHAHRVWPMGCGNSRAMSLTVIVVLAKTCTCMNAADCDFAIYVSFIG